MLYAKHAHQTQQINQRHVQQNKIFIGKCGNSRRDCNGEHTKEQRWTYKGSGAAETQTYNNEQKAWCTKESTGQREIWCCQCWRILLMSVRGSGYGEQVLCDAQRNWTHSLYCALSVHIGCAPTQSVVRHCVLDKARRTHKGSSLTHCKNLPVEGSACCLPSQKLSLPVKPF